MDKPHLPNWVWLRDIAPRACLETHGLATNAAQLGFLEGPLNAEVCHKFGTCQAICRLNHDAPQIFRRDYDVKPSTVIWK